MRALLLSLLLLPATAGAAGLSLEELLAGFAARQELQAEYRETRRLAMLTEELVSHGTLTWRAPDYLRKLQTEPQRLLMEIDGERARVVGPDGGERSVELAQHPQLQALAAALRGTLAGDAAVLRQHYRVALQGSRDHWELRLSPRGEALAAQVPEIRLEGAGERLRAVHTRAASGEESTLRLLDDARR